MKKIYLVTIVFLLIHTLVLGQKLYIWCPNEQEVKPRVSFLENQEINLIIFDGRSIPNNSKIECQSSDVVVELFNVIKKAYPSAKINLLNDSNYYKKSDAGKITIKIGIAAYQAGFGTDITVGVGNIGGNFSYGLVAKGQWNGITSYYAQIFNNRNNLAGKYEREIFKVKSKSNIWGYKTAKVCLNSAFTEANQELLFFIDKSLME